MNLWVAVLSSGLFSGIVGSFIGSWYGARSAKKLKIIELRKELYSNLIPYIVEKFRCMVLHLNKETLDLEKAGFTENGFNKQRIDTEIKLLSLELQLCIIGSKKVIRYYKKISITGDPKDFNNQLVDFLNAVREELGIDICGMEEFKKIIFNRHF